MKVKYYILSGLFLSNLLTLLAVIWAVNRMVIGTKAAYFIIGIVLLSGLAGMCLHHFVLADVFHSLNSLKHSMTRVSNQEFERIEGITKPYEFKELAIFFNQMSDKLAQAFESLAESEHEKDLMIAQLSHDIKTPLTSIQGTVEGMLDGVISPDEQEHYLEIMRRQIDRLNQLVTELNYLTLDLVETPKEKDGNQIVFLDRLILDCLSEFQLQLEQEEREVTIQILPETAQIRSQYDKLSRILINLISNAIKYSPSGSPLQVRATLKATQLQIDIIDHGVGLKDEALPHIFKRLYRVENSRNLETGGYGLGLYIAQQLAHQLEGEIQVQSQYGKGSCFSLVLPHLH